MGAVSWGLAEFTPAGGWNSPSGLVEWHWRRAESPALGSRAAVLLNVAVLVAIGSPVVCLEWGINRALAAGAIEDEMADVRLAIAPVAGPAGSSAPPRCGNRARVMTIAAALEEPAITDTSGLGGRSGHDCED